MLCLFYPKYLFSFYHDADASVRDVLFFLILSFFAWMPFLDPFFEKFMDSFFGFFILDIFVIKCFDGCV